ncbi:hypothetical protein VEV11M_31540 [Escherichia coli]|nr:hypothetical protein VEV11M_31540 [Escherichia coli]
MSETHFVKRNQYFFSNLVRNETCPPELVKKKPRPSSIAYRFCILANFAAKVPKMAGFEK